MKLPKHNNPTQNPAVAPYNFVPLPETVVTVQPETLPDHDVYDPKRHSGYIDCVLTTESPLYIRCAITPEQFQRQERKDDEDEGKDKNKAMSFRDQVKNTPDFFYTDADKTPRIPGSSLRGMLRSLVEIASYSKVEAVSDQKLVYRSVGDTTTHGETYRARIMHYDGDGQNRQGKRCRRYTPLVRAGYMEQDANGDWQIRPAEQIGGTTFARMYINDIPPGLEKVEGCRNAEWIYIQPGPYDYQDVRGGFLQIRQSRVLRYSDRPGAGLLKCALARSGPITSKNTESVIFPPKTDAKPIEIKESMVRTYRDQISREQKKLLGKDGLLTAGQPVFYLMEMGELVFFGHTLMMRLPYPNSPKDLIPPALREPEKVDIAEAIFGYTKTAGDRKARAYAGRVFVGDGVLMAGQGEIWLKPQPIVPRILGGPKPTTFQHYLVQQTPDEQEIRRTRDGRPVYQRNLADYAAGQDQTVLRGHKMYWHKGAVSAAEIEESPENLRDDKGREKEHETQHTYFRPVAAGVRFKFRLHFENLDDTELGALLWVLTLPGRPGVEYRHSLGMGKPYGMGAIKLEPTCYLLQRQERYGTLIDDQDRWCTGEEELSPADADAFVAIFDSAMRRAIGADRLPTLAQVERIATLLRMLEWPGPQPHDRLTRYMEIERRERPGGPKINEYKTRPVLSDPLHVRIGQPATRPPVRPEVPSRPERESRAPSAKPRAEIIDVSAPPPASPAAPKPKVRSRELARPLSAAVLEEGMYLEGSVLRVESSRIVVAILGEEATLPLDQVVPPIQDAYDAEDRFPVGQSVRVWFRKRNKAGRIQLTMQGG